MYPLSKPDKVRSFLKVGSFLRATNDPAPNVVLHQQMTRSCPTVQIIRPDDCDEDCAKTSRDPYRSLKNCGKKREAPEPQRPA